MKLLFWVIASVALSSLVSCVTADQTVTLAPLETKIPVSASASLYVDGKVLNDSQYQVVKPFHLEKKFRIPLGASDSAIDLSREVETFVQGTDVKAVTQLTISVKDIGTGDLGWIAFERSLGAASVSVGALLLGVSTLLPPDQNSLLVPSIIVVGSGAALLGGSVYHESVAGVDYWLNINGVGVKY